MTLFEKLAAATSEEDVKAEVMGRKMRDKTQIEPRRAYQRELKERIDREKQSCCAKRYEKAEGLLND